MQDRNVKMGARSDQGIRQSSLASYERFANDEVREATLLGVVHRECRANRVSVKGAEVDIVEMKKRIYKKRRWVWDIEEAEVQYDVNGIIESKSFLVAMAARDKENTKESSGKTTTTFSRGRQTKIRWRFSVRFARHRFGVMTLCCVSPHIKCYGTI